MKKTVENIDGIVDRCGSDLVGHGDNGFNILLVGSTKIYWLAASRKAYAPVYGREPSSNSALVGLTRPGDHVSFTIEYTRVKEATFRNWTLEARLLGNPEHDVTPAKEIANSNAPDRIP